MLLGAVAIGLGWFVAVLVLGVFGAGSGLPSLLSSPVMAAWALLAAAAALGLGAGTASVCMSLVRKRAQNETTALTATIRQRIEEVTQELAIEAGRARGRGLRAVPGGVRVASNGPTGAAGPGSGSGSASDEGEAGSGEVGLDGSPALPGT